MRLPITTVAGLAALSLTIALSGCGSSGNKSMTLKFTEKDTGEFSFVDSPPRTTVGNGGPEKVSPGDFVTIRDLLIDSSDKQAGEINIQCTITSAPSGGAFDQSIATCFATVTLTDGTLSLQAGGKTFQNDTTGSITGGTGKYANAIGTFTSTSSSDTAPSHDTYNITIVKK